MLLEISGEITPERMKGWEAVLRWWRNSSRKNEETKPKQKQHPVVDGTGDRSKVGCCKSNIV